MDQQNKKPLTGIKELDQSWLEKWDRRFLSVAKLVASWSKDPSTQTGAVIVRPDRTIAATGYNGFPQGIEDHSERLHDRELKYELTVHCEMNAILFSRETMEDYTLYTWPFASCSRCAVHVIQSGITRVVSVTPSEDVLSRWGNSLHRTMQLFDEAEVEYVEYDDVA